MSADAITPTITTTGSGSVSATPDRARIRIGCQASRPTVADAVATSSAAVTRVRAALDARGIGAKDSASGRVSISTQEQWENNVSRIIGYQAEHRITITVSAVDEVGSVLGEVVAAAGDTLRLYGVEFELADDAAVRKEARKDAFGQALEVAQEYAALAGRTLGAVLRVNEGQQDTPIPSPKVRMAAFAAADSAPVPVAPDAVEASATVTVTWELV